MKRTEDMHEEEKIKASAEEETVLPEEEKTSESEQAEEQPEKTETTEDKLAAAETKIAELQDKYLRQVAEFDNYRKRTVKEKAELILNGGERAGNTPNFCPFSNASEPV